MTLLIDEPAPGVRRLRIDRPSARNAIDADTRGALLDAAHRARDDDRVRALVIGGVGSMFSAGGDLTSMVGLTRNAALARMRHGHQVVAAFWTFPKPVIAAVERFAVGAGAGLALLADEVVIGRGAVLGFPFLRLGLIPDWGLTGSVRRRTGAGVAARLFHDAGNVTAEAALALGLVDHLVADDATMTEAVARAEALATVPPRAFAALKRHLRGDDAATALDLPAEAEAQADRLTSPEFAEAYAAFRARRP